MAIDPAPTYQSDDRFDLDKYRQAAGVAYEFSKKKMEDQGEQQRESLGKSGQTQRFSESDEARDYR